MIKIVKNVCFTGHRTLIETAEIKNYLIKQLEILIKNGATDFYAGGALGWDMLCERTVIKLRERYPHIKLHLVLPCSEIEQTAQWSLKDKAELMRLLSLANSVEILSEHYYEGCMKARNQRLVDLSDLCVCYYNENDKRSGTGQTVRMAERKGITVCNIYEKHN